MFNAPLSTGFKTGSSSRRAKGGVRFSLYSNINLSVPYSKVCEKLIVILFRKNDPHFLSHASREEI